MSWHPLWKLAVSDSANILFLKYFLVKLHLSIVRLQKLRKTQILVLCIYGEVTCASQRSRNPANITQHMATEVEEALAANVTCLVLAHFFGTWMNLYNGFLAISCPMTAPCSLLWPQAKRVCGCVSVKPMILVSVVRYVSVHPKSSKTVSCTNNTCLWSLSHSRRLASFNRVFPEIKFVFLQPLISR